MPHTDTWTIVQHSAFGYGDDATFEQGLETRTVTTRNARARIVKAGGLVFDSYTEAEDFTQSAMYPDGAQGLIPAARGTFAHERIDGLAIYIPVRVVVG